MGLGMVAVNGSIFSSTGGFHFRGIFGLRWTNYTRPLSRHVRSRQYIGSRYLHATSESNIELNQRRLDAARLMQLCNKKGGGL